MSENIGYIRVSSEGQNTARQLDGIKLDKVFTDKLSGSTKNRPQLEECLSYIRKGDVLHVHSLDRLARSLRDLLEILEQVLAKGASVRFHGENMLFEPGEDNPYNTMLMQMLGAFAQFERGINKVRQREGIVKAREVGKHMGRPKLDYSLSPYAKELKSSGLGVIAISKQLNLSIPSVYKLIRY